MGNYVTTIEYINISILILILFCSTKLDYSLHKIKKLLNDNKSPFTMRM